MRRGVVAFLLAAALVIGVVGASATEQAQRDYAAVSLNVLPPGQSGSLAFPRTATDQAKLYDGLTPLFDRVDAGNYARYFKAAGLGPRAGAGNRTQRVRRDVTIVRDRFDIPHVMATTRAGVHYGAGWATAEDRLLLMQLLRGPGRVAALDAPGLNPMGLALSARQFVPTAAAEAELAKQVGLLRATAKGRQVLRDIDAYLAGINGYIKSQGDYYPHWTRNDVIAVAAIIAAQFGVGGGDEARRSQFLDALQQQLGTAKGREVFDDLRSQSDPDTPVSIGSTASMRLSPGDRSGNAVLDAGSFAGPAAVRASMSNALLVGAGRSRNGHPLFVAGPQVGYAYPELLLELDLQGPGIHARGAAFPGISFYVLLGRGLDFAWSATSSGTDIVDTFVETLCGGDDRHYLYKSTCREMGFFDAGVLKGRGGAPDREIAYPTTVHGPVVGYATVDGRRVAVVRSRSTRGREALSAIAFQDLNTNRIKSARDFLRTMSTFALTFNWFYADDRDIAMISTGRVPQRAPGVDLALPTRGTGQWDWRGFLPATAHPQGIDPSDGAILNWNNKPSRSWAASDSNWSYQSVHRVELLRSALPAGKVRLDDVVRAMNVGATQDLRVTHVWPAVSQMLERTAAPSERAQRAKQLVDAWRTAGGSRLDRDLDGWIDDAGAAVLDSAWPGIARTVLQPVLGEKLLGDLERLEPIDDAANPGGSSYGAGWYGYVEKDLLTQLGRAPAAPYSTRYCGGGDVQACSRSLWAALDAAAGRLGADAWRADARPERISFGLLPETTRWVNRPTFQQIVTFRAHRPRK